MTHALTVLSHLMVFHIQNAAPEIFKVSNHVGTIVFSTLLVLDSSILYSQLSKLPLLCLLCVVVKILL